MNEMKKFEDMDCEELKPYCPWEGKAVSSHSMCEGRFCEEAYENYVDDYENNNK